MSENKFFDVYAIVATNRYVKPVEYLYAFQFNRPIAKDSNHLVTQFVENIYFAQKYGALPAANLKFTIAYDSGGNFQDLFVHTVVDGSEIVSKMEDGEYLSISINGNVTILNEPYVKEILIKA